ncbi:MAG TPA: N-acetylmuramoyl-L-alanine amidase [Candidatus Hydrogenedentes bacterium]|nr:N-acetylmuramoyl-L-alanine amidase [Candidatus Hydrogenedentota bacterium]
MLKTGVTETATGKEQVAVCINQSRFKLVNFYYGVSDTVEAGFWSEPDTWYDVYIKTYGTKDASGNPNGALRAWVKPHNSPYTDWDTALVYVPPILDSGDTPIRTAISAIFRINLLPQESYPDTIQLKGLKVNAWPCNPTPEWLTLKYADIIITEIQTRNETTLLDEYGHYSPWIELYNRGDSAVNLQYWGLTDEPEFPYKWQFPEVILQPMEYRLVFATGVISGQPMSPDVKSYSGELHTNFSLNPDGGFLALVMAGSDSNVNLAATTMIYPALEKDFSYALFADNMDEPNPHGFSVVNNVTPGHGNPPKPRIVVLDPGHGTPEAGDSATSGKSGIGTYSGVTHTQEYLCNWLVAQQVKEEIEASTKNETNPIKVIITKKDALTNLSNLDRAKNCGDNNASLFISLHFNGTETVYPRGTFAVVLPTKFKEPIGGKEFRTDNRNQKEEIEFAKLLVDAVVKAFVIPDADQPAQNDGVRHTGKDANKGVLFETTREFNVPWYKWAERLYYNKPDQNDRAIAVLLEIDNLKNADVDLYLNDTTESIPIPDHYKPLSKAIAQVIVQKINN